ncbi:MAG: N-acetylmuramoyl-L-alanine amidase [Gammaproteobacteria bacterium]|nr:N-acetylmuramoyl-L-alanine amidase [Gammaproteobacteria bacterium]
MRLYGQRLNAWFAATGCALGLCLAPGGPAAGAEVEGVRIWRAPERTRLVFDLDGEVSYQLIRLDGAGQLLIDLENSTVAPAFDDLDNLAAAGGSVTGLRLEEAPEGILRFVVELDAPVEPRGFILPPIQQYGDRFVLDLYDIVREPARPISIPVPAPDESGTPVAGESDPPPLRDIVVAISAGHGGEDPGAVVGSNFEKNITLPISRYLDEILRREPGYRSIMIRDGDYYVPLRRRTEIAREHRADLLVAIHADAYRSSSASGMTIYALSGERADRENAARVARKENTSDLIAGVHSDLRLGDFDDDVAMTLVSVHMGWSLEQSQLAGSHILAASDEVTRLRRDKVQQASLQVLNSPDIPSILVETGYMTNPAELERLNSPAFQRRLAESLALGIMRYFDERAPDGTLVAWRQSNGALSAAAPPAAETPADEVDDMASALVDALIGAEPTDGGEQAESAVTYVVRGGDTLSEIANRYSVSLSRLRELNGLSNDRIAVGSELKIPR